jgi:CheY-like chemotaxis protein
MVDMNILLVEDSAEEVYAFKRACSKSKFSTKLVIARNGEEAFTLLSTNSQIAKPYIILLDLNMPIMGGIEFLEILRNDPVLCDSLVFVVTTSEYEDDITATYDKNIAGYILKSQVGDDYAELFKFIDCYQNLVKFPLH